jgi:predicted 3-demethylubiquinone-9 3-methyltransferase (glyoxalase superfamily)
MFKIPASSCAHNCLPKSEVSNYWNKLSRSQARSEKCDFRGKWSHLAALSSDFGLTDQIRLHLVFQVCQAQMNERRQTFLIDQA